jgi:hypothetical protein
LLNSSSCTSLPSCLKGRPTQSLNGARQGPRRRRARKNCTTNWERKRVLLQRCALKHESFAQEILRYLKVFFTFTLSHSVSRARDMDTLLKNRTLAYLRAAPRERGAGCTHTTEDSQCMLLKNRTLAYLRAAPRERGAGCTHTTEDSQCIHI